MIRFILAFGFIALFLIFSSPLLLVEYFIGKINPEMKSKSSLAIVNWAFRVVIFITGARLHISGRENIPDDEPVLYVPNHNGYMDIVISYTLVKNPTGYISKDVFKFIPFLPLWMKNLHCKFIKRKDIKSGMKVILDAIDDIGKGISACIFPEGTRNRSGDELCMNAFHEGSLKIATKTGCKIIPVAMTGTADIFENHFPFVKKADVNIVYGKPIDPNNIPAEYGKKVGAYTQSVIYEMLCEIKGVDPKERPLTLK